MVLAFKFALPSSVLGLALQFASVLLGLLRLDCKVHVFILRRGLVGALKLFVILGRERAKSLLGAHVVPVCLCVHLEGYLSEDLLEVTEFLEVEVFSCRNSLTSGPWVGFNSN